MDIQGKVAVVTGGARGIGRALCRKLAAGGAAVVVADRDGAAAEEVAREIGGSAETTDVSREAGLIALVAAVQARHGRIDLFCSNAGIGTGFGLEASDADWQLTWEVNLMAHVWAARAVLPGMLARGSGYLLQTASAAGLLTSLGAAPYAVTKHAAVALAEWLAITYGDRGIRVSCLCPQGVQTDMLAPGAAHLATRAVLAAGKVLSPEQVADETVRAIAEERFLILPHPEVATYEQARAKDREKWLGAMRGIQRRLGVE